MLYTLNYTRNINTHFNGVEHLYLAPPKNTEAIAAPSPAYGRIPLITSELF
jgi:hypothetical protein